VRRQRFAERWSSAKHVGQNCYRNARTGASVHVKIVEMRFAHVDISASMRRCMLTFVRLCVRAGVMSGGVRAAPVHVSVGPLGRWMGAGGETAGGTLPASVLAQHSTARPSY
jgi:hypothetical protein